jgi:hypothetical protein
MIAIMVPIIHGHRHHYLLRSPSSATVWLPIPSLTGNCLAPFSAMKSMGCEEYSLISVTL